MKIKGFYTERKGSELTPQNVFVVFENQRVDSSLTWLEGYSPVEQHFEIKDTGYLKTKCKKITKEQYLEASKGYYTPAEYLEENA